MSAAAPRSGTEVVRGDGLRRVYRRGGEDVVAVDDVSLRIVAGELVAVVGPSGSGKTTLLNLLAGWDQPDGGQLWWRGRRTDHAALPWSELAIVPQRLGILDELTVVENVELPVRLGTPVDGDAVDGLEALGLTELAHRRPTELSLGQRQRVAVARAIRSRPRLLLADEPTGHQDADWGTGVVAALRAVCRDHASAGLVATHDPEVLEQVDRVIELRDGRRV